VSASPNNTVITGPNQSIVDTAGNTWSIIGGQVAVNGAPDPTSGNVTEIAYENGQIWQKNADNLWWSKSAPADSWGPTYGTAVSPIPNQFISPNGTVVAAGDPPAIISDGAGNTWSILNGQVALNGVADPTTARVIKLAYVNGQIWQENADNMWWSKSQPADSWNPVQGQIVTLKDPNGTLTDASGNTWSIHNGQAVVNGVADPTTANVIELASVDGQIWQENDHRLWWSKTSPADQWSAGDGTAVNPVQDTTRVWVGGSGFGTFDTAANWAPYGAPQFGDTALVNTGVVQMQPGDAAGVNYTLTGGELDFQGPTAPQIPSTVYDIGTVDGYGDIQVGNASNAVTVVATGIQIQTGGLSITEATSGSAVANFVINGNSTLQQGSLQVEQVGAGAMVSGAVENDGTMTLDDSQVQMGMLSGKGLLDLTNGSTVNLLGAASSETIDLSSGTLIVGPDASNHSNAMQFLAPVTDFGATSELTLAATHATAMLYGGSSPSAAEWLLYDGATQVASLLIKTSGSSPLQASYDPTTNAVTLATHDIGSGQTLPILTHA
jgi:hypothetical protein